MAIIAWCSEASQPRAQCREMVLECVMRDLKTGDYENKALLERRLAGCLRLESFTKDRR